MKRWNRGIVNGMEHVLGIGRTGRVFHLFRLFHPRERNSWKSSNSWKSGEIQMDFGLLFRNIMIFVSFELE